ncbi:MAG: methylenetetrahydrofolate reductase [NAD(P)H] [Propionibacteriaceae bacterium]|nr:methylenetetrahydrofolate reductase [NAD(P)H] [Propionibacteriaceae bacterium]
MSLCSTLHHNARVLYSFEFFPPKDDEGEQQLWATIKKLQVLNPDFVSVTYGANGSQRERTLELTRRLQGETSLRTMGHLTCVDQSRAYITEVIDQYAADGLDHIFAIRGDMPAGPSAPWEKHPDGLNNATELVELVKSRGDFCVGVAAFPDPHPSHHDPDLDARILTAKWQAGAEFAITQLFFNPRSYVELVDRVRSLGCPIPIIPGIMPITMTSQVVRFAQLSGAEIPASIISRLDEAGGDPQEVRRIGTQIACELSEELIALGAPGLHFFTQNRSTATYSIWNTLRQ